MSKHTPGPWCAENQGTYFTIHGGPAFAQNVGLIYTAADARLVKAAPELLAAAKDVIDWYFDQIYTGPPGPQDDAGGDGVADAISYLRHMIAKAGGV